MELNSELDRLEKYLPIESELQRACDKHPNWPVYNLYKQSTIINEEAGEVAKAVLHFYDEGGSLEDIESELIQTAAMCVRMLCSLKEYKLPHISSISEISFTHTKIEDTIFLEDGFDKDGNPIDGYFTDVYVRKDELKNGGKFNQIK